MITLNTEKGLVKIETWQEILERPGFQIDIDPTHVKLDQIIGSYKFSDLIPCGLSTCHQPHGKGYLVTTTEGFETNIGKDCGKTHFKVDFETMRRTYDRDLRNAQRRETISEFQSRVSSLIEEIEQKRDGDSGASWIHKNMKQFRQMLDSMPKGFGDQFRNLVKSGSGEIQITRVASEQELEDLEAIENRRVPQPHYITSTVGNLRGIECWAPRNDLRNLLVVNLLQKVQKISVLDVDIASEKELATMSKWVADVPSAVTAVDDAVANGRSFFIADNVKQLEHLLIDPKNRKQFRIYVSRL